MYGIRLGDSSSKIAPNHKRLVCDCRTIAPKYSLHNEKKISKDLEKNMVQENLLLLSF